MTFQVSDGRRIALVGGNGAGKTTLLEIVLGTTEADGGEVHRPKDLTVGYLPQEITEWRDGSVLDEVLAGRPEVQELEQRLARLHDDLATTSGVAHDRALAAFGEAQSRFEALGGYAVEADAHRVLAGLGFAPGDAARPLTDMSGGWRMRAALGRLLLAQPDVLILDEPTNHLDTDSVTWLEDTLVLVRRRRAVRQPRPRLHRRGGRAGHRARRGHGDGVRRRLRRVRRAAGGAAGPAALPGRPARRGTSPTSSASSSASATRPRRPARSRAASRRSRSWTASRCPTTGPASPASASPRRSGRRASWPSWSTSPSATTAWPSSATSTSRSSGARRWRSSGPTARARRRCCACCSASWRR